MRKNPGKNGMLAQGQIQMLDKLGFVWNANDAAWEERFREFKEYKETYNNCNVPRNNKQYKALAEWVERQRRLYNGSEGDLTISPTRVKKLEAIGFSWVKGG